ncbi:MAG: hydroxyisourate hydrolase [Methanospirillum sp.]|nr:hydroxyisourate hydrolase [Methanospirillum sp.]
MTPLPRTLLALLALLAVALLAGAAAADTTPVPTTSPGDGGAQARGIVTGTFAAGQPFRISGSVAFAATGLPTAGAVVLLQEQGPDGGWTDLERTTTDADGDYAFVLTRGGAGTYRFRALIDGVQVEEGWLVTVGDGGSPAPTLTTPAPTLTTPGPAESAAPPAGTGTTYADARARYSDRGLAWSRAWGASDPAEIRRHLNESKAAYSAALETAIAVDDPSNEANLALVRTISTAYADMADAALAMYDGGDAFREGRSGMDGGAWGEAENSFAAAAAFFSNSAVLFDEATVQLQRASYAGTEFGDGTAYTEAIVPILDEKAAYVAEFAEYARGWQHGAAAYAARTAGDEARFRDEANLAIDLFDGLRSSAAFGADAAANRDVLAGLLAA